MARIILPTDDLLKQKYQLAKRGLSAYKKIIKDIGDTSRTVIIFQPDGYNDDAVYSLTCLQQLLLTVDPLKVVIITTNPDMADYVGLFDINADVKLIDLQTSNQIMNYALMAVFPSYFYIASLSKPYGRWGDRMIDQKRIGAEHCFANGVYHIWHYKPEQLPIYAGKSQKIIDFLKRALELQKKSIEIDREAMERK